ncbi:MAG: hypothetical protein CFE44_06880 [Burkholderiales bacterium PBB4]|nr:MAG: hypothetical protein CFE44_06880 [Burkholderiales bacterium PBB4]
MTLNAASRPHFAAMQVLDRKYLGSFWQALGGAVFTLGFASTLVLAPVAAAGPTVYGKQLVQTLDVPADTLAKFAFFQAANKGGGVGLLADSEDWRAPEQKFGASGNPYTLVVKLQGTVVADGDVTTIWQTGWSIDGTTRYNRLPAIGATGAKAGMPFAGEATAGPTTFKADSTYSPVVGLVKASNVKIQSVKVEVWSGIGKSSWIEKLFAGAPLLTGLVFLGLAIWWRRR